MKNVIRYRNLGHLDVLDIENYLIGWNYLIEVRQVGEFTNFYVDAKEKPDDIALQLGIFVLGSYQKKVKEIIW